MQRIDIVSDAICPWCWIGKAHLDAALSELGRENYAIHWRAFQLNPDMPEEGVERAAYRAAKFGSAERGAELDAQVARAGAAAGLAFRHDLMRRTPNTVKAHRLLRWAEGPRQHALAEALFRAYFQGGRDVGDAATLAEIAAGEGFEGAAEFLAGAEREAEVRAEDAYFRGLGISGVPTFALDGRVLFSGAVPAHRFVEVLRDRAPLTA